MIRLALLTMLCCLTVCASTTLLDEPAPAARPAETTLSNFAWMSGRWVLEHEGEYLEENWGEAQGNVMLGTFRWLRGGNAWLYEFMLIEQLPEGVVFHLRHFGARNVAWEPKDAPLSYPLASVRDGEAIFENPDRDEPRRFVYRRHGDQMEVRVEAPDGEAESFTFRLVGTGARSQARR
ncbi:MAG: hypothetical protein DRQ55_04595 [Planctomycetota bacterium]|nr:MAG: hypothetical protein DRQ55_04595 [Planctomycetota bacterium]